MPHRATPCTEGRWLTLRAVAKSSLETGTTSEGVISPGRGRSRCQAGRAGRSAPDVAAGEASHVGVLGTTRRVGGGAAADDDRRVRPVQRLGVAERAGQVVVGPVHIEGLGLGLQPSDDRQRLGEASDRVSGVVKRPVSARRSRLLVASVLRRSRSVCAARADSASSPHTPARWGRHRIGMRWSNSQACSI